MDFRKFIIYFLAIFFFCQNLYAQQDQITHLEKELRSSSTLTRHSAAQKLSEIGGERVEAIFNRLVLRDSIEWKRIALVGLASVAPKKSVPLFLKYLDHKSMMIRWAAVIGLGQTGNKTWIPKLKKLSLSDPGFLRSQKRYPVREAAKQAIYRIESSPDWFFSFSEAQSQALKQKKSIILFWTLPGEKWSLKMWKKSFVGEPFRKIKEKFVWVKLDASVEVGLADQLKVADIPTVQLLHSDGVELERWTGYYGEDVLANDLKALISGTPTTYALAQKVKKSPSDATLLWTLSKRYERSNQLERAALLWEKIVSLPHLADKMKRQKALFSLGYYRGSIGEYKIAVPLLKKYLKEFPDTKEGYKARYCLALCYLGKGQKRKSLQELKQLRLEPLPEELRQSVNQVIRKIKEKRRSS